MTMKQHEFLVIRAIGGVGWRGSEVANFVRFCTECWPCTVEPIAITEHYILLRVTGLEDFSTRKHVAQYLFEVDAIFVEVWPWKL